MNVINLQSLVQMINQSHGYIGLDQSTQELKTEGTHFLGRVVTWVRFKFNKEYRDAVLLARGKVRDLLVSDTLYGKDFSTRIKASDPQGSIFYKNKPLSARKVYRFISDVQHDATEKIDRAQGWIDWYSGKVETETSRENFDNRTESMLREKIKDHRGLSAEDINLRGLSDEVNGQARDDATIKTIADRKDNEQEQYAREHVDKTLSEVLDRRIGDARLKSQNDLNGYLEATGLDGETKQSVAAEIADITIATPDELKTRVNEAIVKQMGREFEGLLAQVQEKHQFNGQFMQLPEVQKQLQARLAQQNQERILSVEGARAQTTQLLNQWVVGKQEAVAALDGQYAGMDDLLKKLLLQNPYLGKPQIESIQQDMKQALDEVYEKDADACRTLGLDQGKILSKMHQSARRNVLFDSLKELSNWAPKPDSLFDGESWALTGVKTAMRNYTEDTIAPLLNSYKKVSSLKGKIPDHIHEVLMQQVSKGAEWGPEFISIANQIHIETLTKNNYQGLYRLLQTPEVAQKRIGSKDDLTHFTLDNLLAAILPAKDIANPEKRRQAVDRVMLSGTREQLLDKLEGQLGMVKSRVMNEKDANALFQRETLRFLRELKINFEHRVATTKAEAQREPITYYSTPL